MQKRNWPSGNIGYDDFEISSLYNRDRYSLYFQKNNSKKTEQTHDHIHKRHDEQYQNRQLKKENFNIFGSQSNFAGVLFLKICLGSFDNFANFSGSRGIISFLSNAYAFLCRIKTRNMKLDPEI